ncbi:MAG: hypothetical protein V4524_02835 [Patescibacteria group bacterium]
MNNQTISDLYSKLTELVEAGDESAVRAFLADNIKSFPEDVQKKIVFEFFADAVDKKLDTDTQIAQIQKEGMDSLGEIEKAEGGLKDQEKLSNLRSSLGI